MNVFGYPAVAVLLAVAATAARAGDDVLAPGDPPLTRAVADRKIDFWQSVFGQHLDDRQRVELRQLQAREWGLREREWKERWIHFLPDLCHPKRLRSPTRVGRGRASRKGRDSTITVLAPRSGRAPV